MRPNILCQPLRINHLAAIVLATWGRKDRGESGCNRNTGRLERRNRHPDVDRHPSPASAIPLCWAQFGVGKLDEFAGWAMVATFGGFGDGGVPLLQGGDGFAFGEGL